MAETPPEKMTSSIWIVLTDMHDLQNPYEETPNDSSIVQIAMIYARFLLTVSISFSHAPSSKKSTSNLTIPTMRDTKAMSVVKKIAVHE